MSRWFNYGFDEFTWKRYCEYRKDMVKGVEAMVSYELIVVGYKLILESAETNTDGPASVDGDSSATSPSFAQDARADGLCEWNACRYVQHGWTQ